MVYHRNPTIFFTLFALLGALIEAAAMRGGHYGATWALPYSLAATCLLGLAVLVMVAVQLARWRFNLTPFLPALVLAFASAVCLHALAQPGTLDRLAWTPATGRTLRLTFAFAYLPLAAVSLLLALRGAIARLPLSLHAWGKGMVYRVRAGTKVPTKQAAPAAAASDASRQFPAKPARLDYSKLYGNEETKALLLEAGTAWKDKGKNGILMFGPPGTGKTAFGAALAGELQLPFIYATFGDLASKWVNETTERMVAMFKAAKEQAPCMLFLDELDAVLKDRRKLGAGGSEEYDRIVATFLAHATALQGSNVLLVAATNYIDRLDDAAVREGRFDFKVEIPLPDATARRQIALSRLRANHCETDNATLDRLTRRWEGFNVPRIIAVTDAACEIGRAALAPAETPTRTTGPARVGRPADAPKPMTVTLAYDHFYKGLRKVQGRKGGAPEGAKALSELFLDNDQATRLKEIAAQLVRVDEIERLGGSVPKGVLFLGPPGTGKTATAKALARECGWTFIERNGRDLMGAGEIDKLRDEASDLRPAIVFIDEADDILADRNYSGIKSTTNELLTLMDGAGGALQDVVWIAATNYADGIDAAALRGGRFEQKIAFAPPSDDTLLRMVVDWAQAHAADLAGEPATWAARATELMRGQTPANVQSILRLANNMAVAKHLANGAARAVTVEHVAAAAAEIGQ